MRAIYISILLLSSYLLSAQDSGSFEFIESTHDFGEVKEEGGPIIYDFEFTNSGNSPLIISNVKASCGCTTPAWSKEPVMPGEKGFIKAQYNPMNRPGAFKKSLTITSNGENPRSILYIQGKVIPRIKTVEEELRVKIGALRLKNKTVNMGRMTTKEIKSRNIDVYNDSDTELSFSQESVGPNFIKLSFEPQLLKSKERGIIKVDYDPNFENNLGFQNHNVKFSTDESEDSEKQLNIMATITEYFPPLSQEEKANAPKLLVASRMFDFGKMSQGETKESQFLLTNEGKGDLNIRKIISNCSCVLASLSKYDLKPGESVNLLAKFDSKGRRGNQLKSITIYTNDPLSPTQVISLKGQIETTKL
jgi:hypothetical protein